MRKFKVAAAAEEEETLGKLCSTVFTLPLKELLSKALSLRELYS
jgi:hypothetical protein